MSDYDAFLATKHLRDIPTGIDVPIEDISPVLFDWQQQLVKWALKRGRAAIFAGTGLGKTIQQLEWARHVPGNVLIFAPLGVTHQTIAEAKNKLGMDVDYVRRPGELCRKVSITNYDLLEHFCDVNVAGIVLDESSCLKGITSKRRKLLFDHFTHIPFRLCCTATPAPNDIAEMAMHAQFLGVMKREDMLATFFVHDESSWRIMDHAKEHFYKWLASWSMALRNPSDLGYNGDSFILPPLYLEEHFLPWDDARLIADGEGQLSIAGTQKLHGIGDRIAVRQQTVKLRAEYAAEMIKESLCKIQKNKRSMIESITRETEKRYCGESKREILKEAKKIEKPSSLTTEHTMQKIRRNNQDYVEKNEWEKPKNSDLIEKERKENIISKTKRIYVGNNESTLPQIQKRSEQETLDNTDLPSKTIGECLKNKKEDALYAELNILNSGKEGSISTTITTQDLSEDYCVNHVTWELENSKTVQSCSEEPQNTLTESFPNKWVIWCGLDEEQNLIANLLGDQCVSIYGSLPPEEKLRREKLWREGDVPVVVTKAKIFGWGVNWQHCSNAIFLGMNDSLELFFQTVRRLWRYGQQHPVTTHIVLSEHERPIWENVQRKEKEANTMIDGLIDAVKTYEQEELGVKASTGIGPAIVTHEGDDWRVLHGDCVEGMKQIPDESISLSIFSPPFLSLFQYNASERDLGNCMSTEQFFEHHHYVTEQLLRVLKPGRLIAMHMSQVPAMLVRDGWIGLKDFRGDMTRHMVDHGFIYAGEVTTGKSPQAQAIRIRAKGLSFNQLHKDSAWSRPCLGDYIVLYRKPGENAVPVIPDIDNNTWILWASNIWYSTYYDKENGYRETYTLNVAEGRDEKDTKHICPLPLDLVERCVRLWSNAGETVLDPFSGLGTTGVKALEHNRKYIGCELKESYVAAQLKNLDRATRRATQQVLL